MPWGRLDDSLYDHPKLDEFPSDEPTLRRIVDSLSLEDLVRLAGLGLWARAISYSNRHLTDGQLTRSTVVRRLGGSAELADAVSHAELFDSSQNGYAIHDFLAFNDSRQEVLERRQKEADRKAAYRAAKAAKQHKTRRPARSPSGTSSAGEPDVPPDVPAGHVPAGQARVSRAESQRVSQVSRARTGGIRESRPDPTIDTPAPPNPPRRRGGRNGRVASSDYDNLLVGDDTPDDQMPSWMRPGATAKAAKA